MISVVIVTHNNQADLVAVLGPLVPASMDGLVRELVVADAGSTDATLEIADEAGAVIVRGGRAHAISLAKGPWILLITPRTRLTPAWLDLAKDHISRFPNRSAALARRGWFNKEGAFLIPKHLAERDQMGRGIRVLKQ